MHSPHHYLYTILWFFCILKLCCTPTPYFLDGDILKIGTATFWLTTCVLRGVHWPMIQIFVSFSLQSDITVNCAPHNYFQGYAMAHLTMASYPTKLCLEYSSGDTIDLEMK